MPVAFGIARTVARSIIPTYIKRGMGANAITRSLRSEGLSYRRTVMLKDIRHFNGMMRMERYTRATPGNIAFPKFGMIEIGLERDERYMVQGIMHGYNTVTGEELWKNVSFYDSENRGKDGWCKALAEQIDMKKYTEQETYDSIEILSVEHNRGWSY